MTRQESLFLVPVRMEVVVETEVVADLVNHSDTDLTNELLTGGEPTHSQ